MVPPHTLVGIGVWELVYVENPCRHYAERQSDDDRYNAQLMGLDVVGSEKPKGPEVKSCDHLADTKLGRQWRVRDNRKCGEHEEGNEHGVEREFVDEVRSYSQARRQKKRAQAQHSPRGHQPLRKNRASSTEWCRRRFEVDSTPEIEVIVQNVYASVQADDSDERQQGVGQVKMTSRPGDRQPSWHEDDRKQQEWGSELPYPDVMRQGKPPDLDVLQVPGHTHAADSLSSFQERADRENVHEF